LEVLDGRAVVDQMLAASGQQPHAGDGLLAATGLRPLRQSGFGAHDALPRRGSGCHGSGCWAACGCSGPAYTLSFFSIARPSLVSGSIPLTARVTTRSGCFARTSLSDVHVAPPG